LRLAVVSPFVDRRHGTERALADLLERLAYIYGCEIHLYAQRVEDLDLRGPQVTPNSPSGSIIWHRVPAIPGPHFVQFLVWIFLNRVFRWWHSVFRQLSFDLVLSPGINGLDVDVVIVHALFHRLRLLADKKESGELLHRMAPLRRLHRRLYYGLLTRLERRVYSDTKVTLATVSERIAALLSEYFGRRDVQVIPNGVDTVYFSPGARLAGRAAARERRGFRNDDFVLLLIGNDWKTKGLETVFEALTAVQQLPTRFIVVGSDDSSPFRALADRLGVLNRCHWELPNRNVLDFYAASDLYVSPSREDSFGLPVAEAMACGLPVITSVRAGVSELVQDRVNGFVLSDPSDSRTLAQLIYTLHESRELCQEIGDAATSAAQAWTWEHNAEEAWKLLQCAVAKKNVPA
jgi:UDP-glucose:(heptosyl)LPS alpha-1,3-glucosyltransferase